jgi:hypothetical protein
MGNRMGRRHPGDLHQHESGGVCGQATSPRGGTRRTTFLPFVHLFIYEFKDNGTELYGVQSSNPMTPKLALNGGRHRVGGRHKLRLPGRSFISCVRVVRFVGQGTDAPAVLCRRAAQRNVFEPRVESSCRAVGALLF